MTQINFKRELNEDFDQAIDRVTKALTQAGFGILTRIDMHSKIKEKINKDIPPTVILGACNPTLAHEAYCANTDVTSLLPCNAVVRQLAPGKVSIELAAPTGLMTILGDQNLVKLAQHADSLLKDALAKV